MPDNEQTLRDRIVRFYQRVLPGNPRAKRDTVRHFEAEGVGKKTTYRIIDRYLTTGTTKRKTGSGRKAVVMTPSQCRRLKRLVNHRTGVSQRRLAVKFGCSQPYIAKVIRKLGIRCRKRSKVPFYRSAAAMSIAQRACRRLYDKWRQLDFIIDDEKYFGLSGYQMSGNRSFYTSDITATPDSVATFGKRKFEPKVLLWIAISRKGISKPVLISGRGMAIDRFKYVSNCISPGLLPFIRKHYPNGGYIFWPDKASAHYADHTLTFLRRKRVNFVEKDDNPTNVPQCRPIEDFFGLLATRVYEGNWVAQDVEQLKRRIRRCLRAIPPPTVQATMDTVKAKLLKAYRRGLISVCH